ncbi:MAG: hypothetical protein Q9M13_02100 [Mariprofundales bacterium]|nr:hypothetical protein [Mariprofundales bacterium]
MGTSAVSPVGLVVASAAIDRGKQQRRKRDEHERQEGDGEHTESAAAVDDGHDPHGCDSTDTGRRDEDGHIDCFG